MEICFIYINITEYVIFGGDVIGESRILMQIYKLEFDRVLEDSFIAYFHILQLYNAPRCYIITRVCSLISRDKQLQPIYYRYAISTSTCNVFPLI